MYWPQRSEPSGSTSRSEEVALLALDDRGPGGAAIRGPIDAGLRVGLAEVHPERVALRIRGQAVRLPVPVERLLHGPGLPAIERLPETDRRRAGGEDLVLGEIHGSVQLHDAVRGEHPVVAGLQHVLPGDAVIGGARESVTGAPADVGDQGA